MNWKVFIPVWIAGLIIYLVIVARITLYDILVGLAASLVAALIVGGETVSKPSKIFSPKRILYGLAYILYYLFVIEPKCHIRVAKMILGLEKPRPGLVWIPYKYSSDYSVAGLADSITNTPGTLVVDIDEEKNRMLVHWLDHKCVSTDKAWREIASGFDKWIRKVFED